MFAKDAVKGFLKPLDELESAKRPARALVAPQEFGLVGVESAREDAAVSAVETTRDGIFVCGSAVGPQVIPDCVAQASAAAAKVAVLLGRRNLYLEPTVCHVAAELCRGCGLCVSICEFRAPQLVTTEEGVTAAEVNPALCKGCGTCAVWCPTCSIGARHLTDDQITSMVDSLFLTGVE